MLADPVADLHLLVRLVAALVLSGLIGWERELKGKSAGLRTHMLVGGSAALFVVLAETFIGRYSEAGSGVRFDIVGVLGAVVSGVSFLGAGAIFSSRGRDQQRGLTTAAGLLATAAVGATCGLTHYVLALGSTLAFLVVLHVLGLVQSRVLHDPEANG